MRSSNPKLLIAHAFFLKSDKKQLDDKFKPYPPLATLYAAALLREKGYQISLFDAVLADSFSEFELELNKDQFELLIIYEDDFNFLTKMCLSHVRDATLKMIRRAVSKKIPVVVHSSDASDDPEIYLQQGAEFVIYGEGEQTLLETVNQYFLDGFTSGKSLAGLFYLDNKKLVKTSARQNLKNLDELPQPAWDLIDGNRYRKAWRKRHGYFSLNMVTTRGCPYKCNWCAKPIWGRQYHSHSPNYVAEQLRWLVENFKPDNIWFSDDIFGLKKDWIVRFGEFLEQMNIKVPFMIQSRADLIDQRTVRSLQLSGCEEVWLGVESGSQHILDSMDKDVLLDEIKMARQLLGKADIKVGFFLQLGYPGEDIAELTATRKMLLSLMPDNIGVSVSYPLPGTEFYQKVKHQFTVKTHWVDSDDLDMMFISTFNSSFYRKVRTHLHQELIDINTGSKLINWDNEWSNLMQQADGHRSKHPTVLADKPLPNNRRENTSIPLSFSMNNIKLKT